MVKHFPFSKGQNVYYVIFVFEVIQQPPPIRPRTRGSLHTHAHKHHFSFISNEYNKCQIRHFYAYLNICQYISINVNQLQLPHLMLWSVHALMSSYHVFFFYKYKTHILAFGTDSLLHDHDKSYLFLIKHLYLVQYKSIVLEHLQD